MLTKCPECDLPVSDKAAVCPHCGYPLKQPRNINKKPKHMRLPNGFGQISEIKNRNLRKPFRAMVTTGTDPDTGRPICKPLKPNAYFETYNDAYAALVEYNRNPYELKEWITMNELFEKWHEYREPYLAQTTMRGYVAAWRYCTSVYKTKVPELKISQIKYCTDNGEALGVDNLMHTPSNGTKHLIKILFNLLLDYAVENDIVQTNISRTYIMRTMNVPEAMHHISYTAEEMDKLWSNINVYGVDLILIQCYTGLRPQELCLIKKANFNPENWTITGGMKTESGKNRIIPVHSRIRDLVLKHYRQSTGEYLFEHTQDANGDKPGNPTLTYTRYKSVLYRVIKDLGLNPDHKGHDARKHFATMAKEADMDEYAIKRIMGHKISDLTERVYTDRSIEWLRSEIEKIK